LLLRDFKDLGPGDWVIQSAANSGVGGYVVQLCKARGINLVNVVRRDSATPGLKELGAEHVLVDGPDLAKQVKEIAGSKMHLALDAVAGPTFGRLSDTLERGATLVNYGAMSLQPCQMEAGALIFRDINVRGFWLMNWFNTASKEERMQIYGALTQMMLKGELYAPIDRHFSLDEISEAAAYTWKGERSGKVLLAPNGV
jgi:trans-2-enoyl-CoA reductase